MNEFKQYNLNLISDFPVKVLKEREEDLDLIIPTHKRTINLLIDNMPDSIASRIQYSDVNSIVIRICKDLNNNIGTIHFLNDEGIHSSISNFEVNYTKGSINILLKDYYIDFLITANRESV
jgi:hypothetical protein